MIIENTYIELIRYVTALTKDHIEGQTNCDKMDLLSMKLKKTAGTLQEEHSEPITLLASELVTMRNKNVPCVELLQKAVRDLNILYRLVCKLPPSPPVVAVVPWQLCPKCNGDFSVQLGESYMKCPMCGGQGKIPQMAIPV